MAREIIHHDDVTWLEFGDEDLFDIDLESVPVDRTVKDEGRRDPAAPKTGDEGRGLPVSMREGSRLDAKKGSRLEAN